MSGDGQWQIKPKLWPPRAPRITTYGATSVEVARSCPLRLSFQRDDRFPAKTDPSASIGMAIHAAVEATATADYAALDSLKTRHAFLERVFLTVLSRERQQAAASFRNGAAPDLEETVAHYRRALISIAREPVSHSLPRGGSTAAATSGELPADWRQLREVDVADRDSGLVGRIDRIEQTPQGLVITDFKATGRSDVPPRYANQVKLYAALWQQRYGTWPVAGTLRYLLNNATHHVSIDPSECLDLLACARAVPSLYAGKWSPWTLAHPGDVCKICSYRPWCEPFWQFREQQDASSGLISALAPIGLTGTVQSASQTEGEIRLRLRWAGRFALVIAPRQLFPHAAEIKAGDTVRILDTMVAGQSTQPTIRLDQRGELFVLASALGQT